MTDAQDSASCSGARPRRWPEMLDAAERVDQLGYDHLWTWDHLYAIFGDPYQPIFEGWSLLAGVGTRDRADPARAARRRQHVPQPGARRQDRHDARPHQRRPGDPRHRRGVDGARAHGPRHRLRHRASASGSTGSTSRSARCAALLDGETVTSEPGGHYAFDDLRHLPAAGPGAPADHDRRLRREEDAPDGRAYADMWNAMGTVERDAPQDRGPHGSTATPSGATSARSSSRSASRSTIRDTEAEADRVWKARDGAQPDADGRRRGRRHVLERHARADRRAAARRTSSSASDTVISEQPAPYDVETLERFIGEVKPLVDRG